jgi:hypothetical protein
MALVYAGAMTHLLVNLHLQDNWTSITDAQQAAATRALFDLLQPSPDADKQAVLDQLGAPWRGLWEGWAEGAGGAGWEAANQEQEQQRRDAFIRCGWLLDWLHVVVHHAA